MGKLHSIFKINGKVGDFVYYTLNGKPVVRKAAGKRKGPKSKNDQARTLNSIEFGKASVAGKILRQALTEDVLKLNDRYLYQRVNRLVMQLRILDSRAPGNRTVAGGLLTKEGEAIMAAFEFHKKPVDFPKLRSATHQGSTLRIVVAVVSNKPSELLEVQVNFDKGLFRKHYHSFPNGLSERIVDLKRKFRSRKGYTDFVIVSGKGFLQGVVLTCYPT